jgi:hypothetical protein
MRKRPAATIDEIAFDLSSSMTGQYGLTRTEYREWRKQHREALDMVTYWQARVPALASAPECGQEVAAVAARDPRLLVELAANRGGRETEVESCPTLAQIGAAFPAGHGPGSLLWYLQDASRWLQGEPGRTHATGWLLEHAGDLLTAEDVGALEALLVDPHFASNDGTSSARQKFCHGSSAGIDLDA